MTIKASGSSDKLNWDLIFDEKEKILMAVSSGVISVKSISAFSKSTFNFANKHNIDRILLDHSKTKVEMSFMEMYNRPNDAPKLGIKNSHTIAFVMNPDLQYLTNFFETIFINRGFNYKSFDSVVDAIDWLLKQEE